MIITRRLAGQRTDVAANEFGFREVANGVP